MYSTRYYIKVNVSSIVLDRSSLESFESKKFLSVIKYVTYVYWSTVVVCSAISLASLILPLSSVALMVLTSSDLPDDLIDEIIDRIG